MLKDNEGTASKAKYSLALFLGGKIIRNRRGEDLI